MEISIMGWEVQSEISGVGVEFPHKLFCARNFQTLQVLSIYINRIYVQNIHGGELSQQGS